ncbi:DUF2442 domain-containing protein [Telmatobacter bradus]|uniref:DUF2442 domain-containing protein n=1 Tax=Telmatobacter bradus TaxID=474953 RepID=UPI003B42C18C
MISHEEYLEATRRGEEMCAITPRAVSARYDRRIGRVVIRLNTGLDIAFSPKNAQGLETATWQQLQEIEIDGGGFGIHFPALDADLHIPSLLEGFFGSKKWMAARLGAEGGKVRSDAKANAARKNGILGGRPRKSASAA